METAVRRIVITLVWVGLLPWGQAVAQELTDPRQASPSGPEVIPSGPPQKTAATTANDGNWLIGEQPSSGDGVFGDMTPAGCELCGGGTCEPAPWYTDLQVRVLGRNLIGHALPLTAESVSSNPSGSNTISTPHWVPTALASTQTTQTVSGGSTTSTIYQYTWSDFRTNTVVGVVPTMGYETSAAFVGTIGAWLGQDANHRDNYIEFTYAGHDSWRSGGAITGVLEPVYLPMGASSSFTLTTFATTPPTTTVVNAAPGPTIQFPSGSPPSSTQQTPLTLDYAGNLRSQFPLTTELATPPNPVQQALDQSFNHALQHSFVYTASLDEFELNYRLGSRDAEDRLVLHPNGRWREECAPGGCLSFLFGLRGLVLDERLTFHAQGTTYQEFYAGEKVNEPGHMGQVTGTPTHFIVGADDFYALLAEYPYATGGMVRVQTHNNLFGLQFGADWTYHYCRWEFGVRGKFVPCINFAEDTTEVATIATPFSEALNIRTTASNDGLALITEMGFFGRYHLRPNLCLNASFDLRWISGLATAPDNFPTYLADGDSTSKLSPPARIYSNGSSLLFGPTLGFEYCW
ncbi:MAG: hypothetical protein ABR915_18005 [Thermoguttaceae bacterium]